MQVNAAAEPKTPSTRRASLTLALACLGVVYGDIGTSPLYAFREAMDAAIYGVIGGPIDGAPGITPAGTVVFGVLSLIFWSLMTVVTLKYVFIMLRADNRGEGGILSLMALAQSAVGKKFGFVFIMGVAGAALFYGDAALTPAMSVMAAVEGLGVMDPALAGYELPLALILLLCLFLSQKRGTRHLSGLFGPLVLVWFAMIALAGVWQIAQHPAVLQALNPYYALRFLVRHAGIAMPVLGSVFLVVTGAETFYAYLSHFGRAPIRGTWLYLVFPCLVLNYFGQGAYVLGNPEGLGNPFFMMMPAWALLPAILMAIIATIIASQAVITGTFAMTTQAVQLGLLPRMEIRHMSEEDENRIYMPRVNAFLLYTVLFLCVMFRSAGALASAYGIAVTLTMVVTSILTLIVARMIWKKSRVRAALLMVPFLILELIFLYANLEKLADGGYVPLGIAVLIIAMMMTWVRGTNHLYQQSHRSTVTLSVLQEQLESQPPTEIAGTAIFMTSDPLNTPIALMQNIRHNKVIHAHNIILTVVVTHAPHVTEDQRLMVEHISPRFTRVLMVFGYAETPDVPRTLMLGAKKDDSLAHLQDATFFLGRRSIIAGAARELQDQLAQQWHGSAGGKKISPLRSLSLGWIQRTAAGLPRWQSRLYIMLAGNAVAATDFYRIPRSQVVELGVQLSV